MKKSAPLLACVLVVAGITVAFAQTTAGWKPGKFNKQSTCRPLWIGLSDVPGDINAATRDTTLVCHTKFVLSHDNVSKTPDWVVEHLTKQQVSGKGNRPKISFSPQQRVPPVGRASNGDYTNTKSALARGHMAPSEDFNQNVAWMKESFVFSNAVPQAGAHFNGTVWAALEEQVRIAARKRQELYVITGPVRGTMTIRSRILAKADNACGNEIKLAGPDKEAFVCAASNKSKTSFCSKGVAVPIGLYKIVFDPKSGDSFAFVMPNIDHPNKKDSEVQAYLEGFRVNVAAIESLTGLRFFQDLPAEKRDKAAKACAPGTLW